jgi:N-acetylmuramoyl-L-alanine amidase
MGGACEWDAAKGIGTFSNNARTVSLCAGSPFYRANKETYQYPVAPMIIHDSLFIHAPLAVVLLKTILDNEIVWDDTLQTIVIERENGSETESVGEESAAPREMNDRIKTVVIDPGHGGKDPGAIGQRGVLEKDIVLAISLQLRDILKEEDTTLAVYLTREKDEFIELRDRTKFANEKKADIFISIHINSIAGSKKRKNTVKGYKMYFLSQAKNEEDRLVAMKENAVVELEDSPQDYNDLQFILIDLVNNEYLRESQDLSILLAEEFDNSVKKMPKLHRGVGQANFWVLNGAYMPSVLIEAGFISNPKEETLLTNERFQKRTADSIAKAIVRFKQQYERNL